MFIISLMVLKSVSLKSGFPTLILAENLPKVVPRLTLHVIPKIVLGETVLAAKSGKNSPHCIHVSMQQLFMHHTNSDLQPPDF